MSNVENEIKTVIETLAQCFEQEQKNRNNDVYEKMKEMRDGTNRFWNKVEIGLHDINSVLSNLLEIPPQKNVYIAEYIVNGLYEHYFRKLIENTEGSSCCADKSRFIKSMTIKALKAQENLSLYDDYKDVEQITEDKERQAYWSPKTIPDTDTAMKMFWDWYLLRTA